MFHSNIMETILLGVSGIISILLAVSFVRNKVEIKVLKESKMDLETKAAEAELLISRMERTLPMELYREAVKEEGGRIRLTPAYLPFVVMDMNTEHFTEQIHAMQAKEIFDFINSILVKTVPYVYDKNGIIDKFYKAGFTAFFDKSCEEALEAAVSISQIIYQEAEQSEQFRHFSVGMCYGSVLAGIAGTDKRMSLITVSEYTELSSFLQSIAGKYDSRILITGTLRNKVEAFEQKFHARKLGYVYITSKKSLEEIYDVFDGDPIVVRNNKRKTKIVFEKGVAFYTQGEYEKARQYFIEVFKTNRYDGAAKEYLMRCEKNIAEERKNTGMPQIETY